MKFGQIIVNNNQKTILIDSNQAKFLADPCLINLIIDWDKPDFDVDQHIEFVQPLDSLEMQWLPPITNPGKIFCIGRNYAEHAAETGASVPEIPVVFSKFPTALTGHQSEIILPPISQQVDFEAELVVVIGKQGRNIPLEEAMDHVFGYTCGNDISARDWQKGRPGGQWLLGKTFDTFAPLGPTIITKDEIANVHQLEILLELNGNTMQHSNTKNLIFPIDFLISHLSRFCTLQPGDLLFTGTPSGVGTARKPPVYLQPEDQLVVKIDGCNDLENKVVSSS